MKGLILHNAYYREPDYLYQTLRLQEEFAALGIEVDVKADNALLCVDTDGASTPYADYDFCIFWDKDLYLLRVLQEKGVPMFNSLEAVAVCDDKMLTFLALSKLGFPILKTLASPLCFSKESALDPTFFAQAESILKYPIVLKSVVGSRGEGVYLVSDRNALEQTVRAVAPGRYILQEYIASSYGTDVRVLVLGGKVLGAIRRHSDGFLANVAQGGKAKEIKLDEATTAMCEQVANALHLDYCGIDLLVGTEGRFWVCEVNSNAFFAAFEGATGINVAHEYAQYVWMKLRTKDHNLS